MAAPSRSERTRQTAASLRVRAQRLEERAQVERSKHKSVDTAFEMADRDGEVAGGILAAALAYRVFIWLLPLALVAVAGLGVAADTADESPEEAAESLGFDGLVTNSIAGAAESPNRWYALAIGIPILVWTTRSLLRVLIGANRLVWTDLRDAAPKPTLPRAVVLLLLLLGLFAVSAFSSTIRAWSPGVGLVGLLLVALPYAAIWLLVSLRLPHRDAPWDALLPGAVVFGIGVQLLQLFTTYVLEPWAIEKQGTYGALGAAAALLFTIFLISRLIVGAAVLNATLWTRRARGA
jgi:uncharacterized BrkB/YihY/UPF0761 family membrane protein